YNASDTIHGGSAGSNTLVLQDYQGNNTITLSQDATNVNAADFTVNGQTLRVGDFGTVSNIQTLEILTGSGNDTVTIDPSMSSLPPGLTGLKIVCGSGNNTVDARGFTGNETIVAGAGNDVIKVGAIIGAASQLTGTPTSELDLEDTTSLP